MIFRIALLSIILASLLPGCATTPAVAHREAIEIVVWAALAAIDNPSPTLAPEPEVDDTPHPQAKPIKPAATCTTGSCRSVIVR